MPLVLDPIYQAELNLTAQIILERNAMVFGIVNSGINPATTSSQSYFDEKSLYWSETYLKSNPTFQDDEQTTTVQFGNPQADVSSANYSAFNSAGTLANLYTRGLSQSLQAQILSNNGFMR